MSARKRLIPVTIDEDDALKIDTISSKPSFLDPKIHVVESSDSECGVESHESPREIEEDEDYDREFDLPILEPGYVEKIGLISRVRKLKFKLAESLFCVILSRFVLSNGLSGPTEDDDTTISPSKRIVRLSLEVCEDIMKDREVIQEMCTELKQGGAVEFRGVYACDMHLILEAERDYFEIRRCYFRYGSYHRTTYGVIVYADEMIRLIRLIQAAVPELKTQSTKLFSSTVCRNDASKK